MPAWKNQLAEKLQEQGGAPFHFTTVLSDNENGGVYTDTR